MEEDTWSFGFSGSSRSYQSTAIRSHPDFCFELEEIEGYDDLGAEYPCPFCSEDYGLVELCCHIDEEHPLDAYNGVCPVCASRVKTDMVEHITTYHRHILKREQKHKLCKGESYSLFSSSRNESFLHSLLDGSPPRVSSSKPASDPFLSFIYNVPSSAQPELTQPDPPDEARLEEKSLNKETLEKNSDSSALSDAEQIEKAKRSEFVQGLLFSTIFNTD